MQLCRAVRYKPCPHLTHPAQLEATLIWLMYRRSGSGALSLKCGTVWCTSTSATGQVCVKWWWGGADLEKSGIRAFLHAFFLIHPSACRWGNSSWKVQQEKWLLRLWRAFIIMLKGRMEIRSNYFWRRREHLLVWLLIITATNIKKKKNPKQYPKTSKPYLLLFVCNLCFVSITWGVWEMQISDGFLTSASARIPGLLLVIWMVLHFFLSLISNMKPVRDCWHPPPFRLTSVK